MEVRSEGEECRLGVREGSGGEEWGSSGGEEWGRSGGEEWGSRIVVQNDSMY